MGSWIIGKSYDIVRQSNDSRTMTYGFTMIAWWEGNIALYMRVVQRSCDLYDVVRRSYDGRAMWYDLRLSRTTYGVGSNNVGNHSWSLQVESGQVRVGSKIAQNHSSREVTSGHYFPQFIWQIDQNRGSQNWQNISGQIYLGWKNFIWQMYCGSRSETRKAAGGSRIFFGNGASESDSGRI